MEIVDLTALTTSSPSSLDPLLDIRPKRLRPLQRREVPTTLVLLIRNDVPVLLQHMLDAWKQLVREEAKANRLLDVG